MDPKETLRLAAAAFAAGALVECLEHLTNYRDWRAKGGFAPDEHADENARRMRLDANDRLIRRRQAFEQTVNRKHPMGAARIVRRERFAWPGGYPLVLVLADGAVLCHACVSTEWTQISSAHRARSRGGRATNGGWEPEGYQIEEAPERDVLCDHCSERIAEGYLDQEERAEEERTGNE